MGFKTTTEPTVEPIPIEECRLHLRLDDDLTDDPVLAAADNADILARLGAAREYCEGVLGVFLVPRTVEQALDVFPGASYSTRWCGDWGNRFPSGSIVLEAGPVRTIEAISYSAAVDGASVVVAGAGYVLNDFESPARVELAFETDWPRDVRNTANAVRVRYVVGYGDVAGDVLTVPKDVRAAMLLILGHLYENREESTAAALQSIPLGVHALLSLKRENRGV